MFEKVGNLNRNVPLRQSRQRQGGEDGLQDVGDVLVPADLKREHREGRSYASDHVHCATHLGSNDVACLVTSASSACKLGATDG